MKKNVFCKPALTLESVHDVKSRCKPRVHREWLPKRYQKLDVIQRELERCQNEKVKALQQFKYF